MLSKFFSKKSRGFTLVELLIVVAIIGVLSTLGVPTFRRMIQKSKKSEAKVNLGALYTAEAAFKAEYSVFGNNLHRMGFEIDGSPANMTYNIGFFAASCQGQGTAQPTISNVQGTQLNQAYPAYYTGFAANDTRAGYAINSGCVGGGDASADGLTFTARAEGVVSPSYVRANPSATTHLDIWTMDQGRTLVNTQDGVF
jgi:type IV pilus assembly protein PilA